jgi:hypothetical protein
MNSRLFVNGDVSMNSRLFVASDASLSGKFYARDIQFDEEGFTLFTFTAHPLTGPNNYYLPDLP